MSLTKWPLYKEHLLLLGKNIEAPVAVVTCWSRKEEVATDIWDPEQLVSVIGNLYSPNRGLDYLVANVLAHPFLKHLLVLGHDLTKSGAALVSLVRDGFVEGKDNAGRDCWLIPKVPNARMSRDFSREDLECFRDTVVVDADRLFMPVEFGAYFRLELGKIAEEYKNGPIRAREPRIVTLQERTVSKTLPHLPVAHRVVGETVAEAWVKILDFLLKFGVLSNTQYQSMQQEHLDLVSVIEREDPNDLFIPEWFPFDRERFAKYLPTVVDTLPVPEGVSYYYSDRMRVRWGDQIAAVMEKLRKSPDTRQATVTLWDPTEDLATKDPPCLNKLWFRIQEKKLFLSAVIRSNDMFRGYPGNALALRVLQEMVRKGVDETLELGHLVITSESAHIYDESWEAAGDVVRAQKKTVVRDERTIVDPSGMFLIALEESEIVVRHLYPTGEDGEEFRGMSALGLYLKIQDLVSLTEHALYLGAELQKAEHALKLGLPYTQDRPLPLKEFLTVVGR